MRRRPLFRLQVRVAITACVLGGVAGCSDAAVHPLAPVAATAKRGQGQHGHHDDLFAHYVAIGTSISMGWRSDGVLASSQETS